MEYSPRGRKREHSKSRLAGSPLQQNSICRCTQVVVRGSTRNQAGILEVAIDFLANHRQKHAIFYN